MKCLIVAIGLAAALTVSGAQAMTVAVVGDSISLGLARELARLDDANKVKSWGVTGSGLTSTRRVSWPERAAEVAASRPNVVIVQIGTNDAVGSLPRDYRGRVAAFLAPFRGTHLICLRPLPPVRRDIVRGMPAVEAALREGCRKAGAEWLDVSMVPASEWAGDGVHLTASGYGRLAKSALAALKR